MLKEYGKRAPLSNNLNYEVLSNTQDSAEASDLTPTSSEPVSQDSRQKHENTPRIQDRPVLKNHTSRLLPKGFIDRVRDSADIREVVAAEGIELKRKGSNWTARCPQHGEKTASFHVTPSKGQFYCFGCQWGGDVFKFIQDTRGVSFREAVLTVAASCGMSPPESEPERPKAARAPRDLTVELEPEAPPIFEVYDL